MEEVTKRRKKKFYQSVMIQGVSHKFCRKKVVDKQGSRLRRKVDDIAASFWLEILETPCLELVATMEERKRERERDEQWRSRRRWEGRGEAAIVTQSMRY